MNIHFRVLYSVYYFLLALLILMSGNLSQNAMADYLDISNEEFPRNVYWGDTHLHTNMSVDANGLGNKDLSPDDAYRFSKGEVVITNSGLRAQLERPLDFLVVADHAVNMGVMPRLAKQDPLIMGTAMGRRWFKEMKSNPFDLKSVLYSEKGKDFQVMMSSLFDFAGADGTGPTYFWNSWKDDGDILYDLNFRRSVWQEVTLRADSYYQPGFFTTFSAYEWTPAFGSLHRVVLFQDAAQTVSKYLPYTKKDSENPEDLWDYLARYEQSTGGAVMAIAHNGNLSDGNMFSLRAYDGQPINKEYAKARSRWEPLYEVTQMKGDGEAHPLLSPYDDFADYETWNGWDGRTNDGSLDSGKSTKKKSEYARSALKLGLQQNADIGANPFKFGMIGGTDSHTSLSTADERYFFGKFSLYEPSRHRVVEESNINFIGWEFAASGYGAIWAEENTRESLFAAMKRKEVYASTGPRITVRFFGGWDYQQGDAFRSDLARIGYEKGVPMGGDLTAAPESKAPRFLIRAVKDPDGANLDRVQVIKGWHDANGDLHEKIYNVALSDDRIDLGPDTKPVGNTVDIPDASYTNTIGDTELAVVWRDPDFDKDELAFYYLRVLEIPTPRWTAYDAKHFKLKNIPEEVPMITQERAYTSPIWYTPASYH